MTAGLRWRGLSSRPQAILMAVHLDCDPGGAIRRPTPLAQLNLGLKCNEYVGCFHRRGIREENLWRCPDKARWCARERRSCRLSHLLRDPSLLIGHTTLAWSAGTVQELTVDAPDGRCSALDGAAAPACLTCAQRASVVGPTPVEDFAPVFLFSDCSHLFFCAHQPTLPAGTCAPPVGRASPALVR